jgi:hypothetical protein
LDTIGVGSTEDQHDIRRTNVDVDPPKLKTNVGKIPPEESARTPYYAKLFDDLFIKRAAAK